MLPEGIPDIPDSRSGRINFFTESPGLVAIDASKKLHLLPNFIPVKVLYAHYAALALHLTLFLAVTVECCNMRYSGRPRLHQEFDGRH